MANRTFILFAACALSACASGPHPALKVAASDLDCKQSGLSLHEIYPKKVRIEGCDRRGIYVETCDGYGVGSECGWQRYYANDFERDAAERERAERAERDAEKARQAKQERGEREEAEREAAEQEAAEKEAAEREKAEKERAEEEAERAEEESSDDDESDSKPKSKKTRQKGLKRGESLDDFLN